MPGNYGILYFMVKSMAFIQLKDIRKIYKLGEVEVHALAGVSLNIERGEYLALMGSSGSGKSTLMNTLGCIDRPTSGSYLLDGEEVVDHVARRACPVAESKDRFRFSELQPAVADQRIGKRGTADDVLPSIQAEAAPRAGCHAAEESRA